MNSLKKYIEVILPLPLQGSFTYSINNSDEVSIGQRVVVHFGKRKLYTAIVIDIHTTKPTLYDAKDILAVLDESNVVHFPVRFIWEESPMLRDKYSILVKQYVQSLEAYTYYKTLNDLGQSESLLSQSQTGFVKGNISSVSNPDKKVLGFFEASSVTSKRIYFNYFDFGYEFPLYFFECEKLLYLPTKELKSKIENEKYQIVDWTEDGPIKGYYIYKETCTDCTSIASKIKPNFWED
jgi:hypothetical protein